MPLIIIERRGPLVSWEVIIRTIHCVPRERLSSNTFFSIMCQKVNNYSFILSHALIGKRHGFQVIERSAFVTGQQKNSVPLSQIKTPGELSPVPSKLRKLIKESSIAICKFIKWVSYRRSLSLGPLIPLELFHKYKVKTRRQMHEVVLSEFLKVLILVLEI